MLALLLKRWRLERVPFSPGNPGFPEHVWSVYYSVETNPLTREPQLPCNWAIPPLHSSWKGPISYSFPKASTTDCLSSRMSALTKAWSLGSKAHTQCSSLLSTLSSRSRDQPTDPELLSIGPSLISPSCLCFARTARNGKIPKYGHGWEWAGASSATRNGCSKHRTLLWKALPLGPSRSSGILFTTWQLSLKKVPEKTKT